MSLTVNDLDEIRNIIEPALTRQTDEFTKLIQGEIEALRNDIAEVYDMISDIKHSTITDRNFKNLSLEQKILTLNAELLSAAKQAGIKLPR